MSYQNYGLGYHELEDSGRHLLVATIPESEQIVYLELKESAFSSLDKNEGIIHSALLVVAGLVIITGLIPAIITARLISQPISDLAKETQEDWHSGKELSNSQRLDEVGTLSRALQTLLQRQTDLLEREKHFTRHASHEMRTPIAVIRNALAVVKLPNCDGEKMNRNIHHIGEACTDLDLIVSTFLMLGRQNSPNSAQKAQVPLLKVVDAALKRSQQLVKAKEMTTSMSGNTDIQIHSNEALLQVAINNLIRNAANHGSKEIAICFSKSRIDISNPIDTNVPARTGYGFGIEIVQRICQVEGWTFTSQNSQSRFQSSIEFNPNNVT
ncbi:HAMP domain-containing sensor histidine kinase [uncultured Pseudoteredinibacter sp.]|uniref:sensor histidine kinase n=1 Tax=uncultured Pseudoteredinibacter sp. TaxID=1641701 RepID=UPI00261E9163|nr:HAMP domain-containing sensor histidine kinase [uncultured Pseudoteredinibacter sp.]